jgi:hypothetical protein
MAGRDRAGTQERAPRNLALQIRRLIQLMIQLQQETEDIQIACTCQSCRYVRLVVHADTGQIHHRAYAHASFDFRFQV